MTNFKVGDFIRAKQDSEWSWGDKFEAGDIFRVNRKEDLVYFHFVPDESDYFELVDVETYGRHHTNSRTTNYGSVTHQEAEFCICNFRNNLLEPESYHGKHRYEDHNSFYHPSVAPQSNFAWR